jgi:hypothetical protein
MILMKLYVKNVSINVKPVLQNLFATLAPLVHIKEFNHKIVNVLCITMIYQMTLNVNHVIEGVKHVKISLLVTLVN